MLLDVCLLWLFYKVWVRIRTGWFGCVPTRERYIMGKRHPYGWESHEGLGTVGGHEECLG